MNVLVIGAGAMGFNHIRTFSQLKQVNSITVVEPDLQNRKRVEEANFKKVKTVDSLSKVDLNTINAASVTVPTALHFQIAKTLIENKIPTLIEKPITSTIEEGKKLLELANKNKVLVTIGHIERFNPAVRALKANISMLGEIFYASIHRFGVPTNRKVGSAFIDQAVHDVDVLFYLTSQPPISVMAQERRVLDNENADLCTAIFNYGKFIATIEANRVSKIKNRDLIILGTKAIAKLDYVTQDLTIITSENLPSKFSTFDEIVMIMGKGSEYKPYFTKEEPLKVELSHFLNCVNESETSIVTIQDGLCALAAALAAEKSAQTGKKEEIQI